MQTHRLGLTLDVHAQDETDYAQLRWLAVNALRAACVKLLDLPPGNGVLDVMPVGTTVDGRELLDR